MAISIKRVRWTAALGRELADAAGVDLQEIREDVMEGRSAAYHVTDGNNSLYLVARGEGQDWCIDAAAGSGLLSRALCDRVYQACKAGGMTRIVFVTTEAGIVGGLRHFGYHPDSIGYNHIGKPVYAVQVS